MLFSFLSNLSFLSHLAVAFFDVSDFCHIKYFEFREIVGEQQYIKPAKLRFVIIAIWFLSKFCFSQVLYQCNWTRTKNHLVHKQTLNYFAKQASLKLQISCLLRARSSLTFRQLQSVDLPWIAYVTWQEYTVLYHCFGMRFCNKTGIFILSRRKIFLGIAYRFWCQERLRCSQGKP